MMLKRFIFVLAFFATASMSPMGCDNCKVEVGSKCGVSANGACCLSGNCVGRCVAGEFCWTIVHRCEPNPEVK